MGLWLFGSHVSYLYPSSLLVGPRASCEFTGITFAGATQNLDTGCKVTLAAPDTRASVDTKSLSKGGGISTFRSSVVVTKKADRARIGRCSSLMLDDISRSDTIPAMDVRNATASVGHEATIGRIGDDKIFYLMSRGFSEQEARTMIVNGFARPRVQGAAARVRRRDEQPHQARDGRGDRLDGSHATGVDRTPAQTWNWLKTNDCELKVPTPARSRPRRRGTGGCPPHRVRRRDRGHPVA